jgi:hypothetical protein
LLYAVISVLVAAGLVVGALFLWIDRAAGSNVHLLEKSSSICAKAGYGEVGAPIPVGVAVARLRAAGMSVHPWDSLPVNDLIVECNDLVGSTLVDKCGLQTPAPPSLSCTPLPTTTTTSPNLFSIGDFCAVGYSLGGASHFASC